MAYTYDKKTEQFKSLVGDMVCTYIRKNKDYGNSFSSMRKQWGWSYPLIHLEEKLARVKSILIDQDGKPSVTGEGAEDSLLDLAIYSVMTLLEIKEEGKQSEDKKRVYISGRITGDPDARRKFSAAAARLQELGYDPVNPFDNGLSEDAPWADHIKIDLELLKTCGYIYKIPGWSASKGAMVESATASSLGIKELTLKELISGKCYGAIKNLSKEEE